MRALRMIWKRTRTIPLRLVVVLTGLLRLLRHGVAIAVFAVLTVCFQIIRTSETMHDRDLPTYHMRALRMIWKRTRTIPLRLVVVLTGLLRLLRHGVAIAYNSLLLPNVMKKSQTLYTGQPLDFLG